MITFSASLFEFVLATFIPLYFGMIFIIYLQKRFELDVRYLSAFALGLMFWFFFDTLNDAVQLDVNEGFDFRFSASHSILLIVFIFGFFTIELTSGIGYSGRVFEKDSLTHAIVSCAWTNEQILWTN
jgi:hypothetical protein